MNLSRVIVAVGATALLLGIADATYAPSEARDQIRALASARPDTTGFMREAIAEGHPVRERVWAALADIAPVASCAVVVAEDGQYFSHGTLDWNAQRAMIKRMTRGDFSRGGSGIPQQLARNLFLTPGRTPRRKAREYVLAYELSHALTKLRLLELYLNVSEWGDGIWGIDAASRQYFGVPASALTPAQSVVLASILPAPRRGLPFALTTSVARRQENIARSLWRARLLSDADFRQTLDRVREWRNRMRTLGDARAAWQQTTELMGPEVVPTVSGKPLDVLDLARVCDPRRRGL